MLIPGNKPPQKIDETIEIPNRLLRILQSCASDNTAGHRFPRTEVFNEGWMLRLVLDVLQTVPVPGHPLNFLDGATWYSEARLSSPFLRRPKKVLPGGGRDSLGEGYTNVDGVIGHFGFDQGRKAKLELAPDARQFIVVEAKIFSNLSSGTTNAPAYDQAARTVACMAETIKKQKGIESVGFFVVAPTRERRQRRKRNTNLEACVEPDSIRSAVNKRIEGYNRSSPEFARELSKWEGENFLPLVDRLEKERRLSVLSWEQIIEPIADIDKKIGNELRQFYAYCLKSA